MIGRLTRGIAANGFGQVVTIASQVVSVPLLIRAWGTDHYGTWVLLTAIPTALAFADGGLAVAGGNAMAMMVGRGGTDEARAVFRAVRQTVTTMCLSLGALTLLPFAALPFIQGMPDAWPAIGQHRGALAALFATVLVGTIASVPSAALRAGGHYARSVTASTVMRLTETAGIVVVALAGGGLTLAALAWLAVRLAGALWLAWLARRHLPWLDRNGSELAAADLGPLRAPALASLAMPVALAVGLQGVTIALGSALAPEAVALFSATRTLTRAIVQVSGLVNHALMPEMARLAGRGDHAGMATLGRRNTLWCGLLLGCGWAATLMVGPAVMIGWTGGHLQPDGGLIGLLATAALLHGLWLGPANLLLAVNRQTEFAGWLMASASVVALLAGPVARWAGLDGVAALTLAGEAVMALRLWGLGRGARRASPLLQGVPS